MYKQYMLINIDYSHFLIKEPVHVESLPIKLQYYNQLHKPEKKMNLFVILSERLVLTTK